jgi:hypothetical protein
LQHNFFAIAVPGLLAFMAMGLVNHRFHASSGVRHTPPAQEPPQEPVFEPALADAAGSRP